MNIGCASREPGGLYRHLAQLREMKMGNLTHNGFIAMMAKTIENAIIQSGNPFVDDFLDRDVGVEGELHNLRMLQRHIALNRHGDMSAVGWDECLKKYVYNRDGADIFLRCVHLNPPEYWRDKYYASMRTPDASLRNEVEYS